MAVPRKAKRVGGPKRRGKTRQDEELDSLGDGPSDGPSKSDLRGLGELIKPLASHLNFAAPAAGSQEAAAALSLLAPEVPELRTSLRQLTERLGSLRTAAEGVAQRLANEENGSGGEPVGTAAYMDMKVQMLLSYVVALTYYLLLKSRGAPVRDHAVALRLMWLRTLLEKLRPIDQRLQYQMNKLLQAAEAKAAAGPDAASDPRALRPGELAATVGDEESGEEAEEAAPLEAEEDDGLYRPPRIAQVEYTGDHITTKERAERDYERQKRRFERSDMVRSLREEFTDAPAEIRGEERSNAAEKAQRKLREVREYEEENMVRLRASKEEKKERQRLFKVKRVQSGGAVSLEDFADLNDVAGALEGGGKGKGKGKGRGKRGGSALQNFQSAGERMRNARGVVDSVAGGLMPEGMGTFKRGRGGGGDDGRLGGKRQKTFR